MAKLDSRAAAAKAIAQVIAEGQSLSSVMPKWQARVAERDRALLQELVYGTLRWHGRLDALIKPLLRKPFKKKDSDIEALLRVGLYQLLYMRVPDHAAVSATVAASRGLGKPWAKNLCNGILRNFQRDADRLQARADADLASRYAHPAWLVDSLTQAYPDQWQTLLQANNQHPPMTLRVNALHHSRDDYLQRLRQAGIGARPTHHSAVGITLDQAVDVSRLPGFDQGWVSVQDEAAQLAAPLLDLQPGQRVLDACAAPGGKTAHILEQQPQLQRLLAIDSEATRLTRLEATLSRLGLHADIATADAARPQEWWDGAAFDRILLDAPCSASGVIRRHPDIKWLRRAEDIDALAQTQGRILNALWPLLKPGGMLLYVTCSVLPRENQLQLQRFLAAHNDAREQAIAASWGHRRDVGRQIIPGEENMDGFFYACIRKQERVEP